MKKRCLGLVLVTCLQATTAFATEIETDDQRRDRRVKQLEDGNDNSAGSGHTSRITLEAGDADSKASVRISRSAGNLLGFYTRYELSASAPFDSKKQDSVDVGTLSGLTAGTSTTAALSLIDWPLSTDAENEAIKSQCEELTPRLLPSYEWRDFTNLNIPRPCSTNLLDLAVWREIATSINAKRKACSEQKGPPSPECQILAGRNEAALPDNAAAIIDAAKGAFNAVVDAAIKTIHVWTIGVTGNKNNVKYVLAETPTTLVDEDKKGWGITAAYTAIHRTMLWRAGYSYERAYKPKDKVSICSPLGTTGSFTCSDGIVGAPEREPAQIGFVEIRSLISPGRFALSPRAEYDFEKSDLALHLPLYFIPNDKNQLTAGLAIGYTTKEDDFGISVFVGKSFAFFGD